MLSKPYVEARMVLQYITYHSSVRKEQLVKLGGKRREEAAERRHEPAEDRSQSRRFPPAYPDDERRQEEADGQGHSTDKACTGMKIKSHTMHKCL